MKKVFSITWKDLLQTVREWKAAFFMLIMPVVFTLFFGLVFRIDETDEAAEMNKGERREDLAEIVDIEGILETAETGGETVTAMRAEMERLLDGREAVITTIPVPAADGPAETSRTAEPGGPEQVPSGFTQSSPGMIIQFTILGLISTAMILLYERKSKTMGRMIAAPVRFTGIIAGHTLAMLTAVYIQQLILVLLGRIVFKVPYFTHPGALLVLLFFFALWATSLGVLISTLAKKEEQVITLSIICMFIFSAFGGAWFPLEIAGSTFSKIGHIFPTAWAMDGLQDIILRGKGIRAMGIPILICAGYTLVFFTAASLRLKRLRSSV